MTPALTPVFADFIPEVIEEGKLYISQTYATAVHKCCCGCGHRVVTPLSPTGWRLTVEGKFVSLYPSIGNWGYPCRSHYWILRDAVHWSYEMSPQEIEAGRRYDAELKQRYYESGEASAESGAAVEHQAPSVWTRIVKWLFG